MAGGHSDLSLLRRESLKVAPSAGGNETPLRQAAGAGSLLGLTTSTEGEESDYLREKFHIKLQFRRGGLKTDTSIWLSKKYFCNFMRDGKNTFLV